MAKNKKIKSTKSVGKSKKSTRIISNNASESSRINRIIGQIRGVQKMIEEEKYCPAILTQLKAVRSALKSLEGEILAEHLKSCLTDVLKSGSKKQQEAKISELKDIFLKL